MLTRHSTDLADPGVVPSLADRWSHHTGGTRIKVVPCRWRATVVGVQLHRAHRRVAASIERRNGSSQEV
jgi:hypothetical protein